MRKVIDGFNGKCVRMYFWAKESASNEKGSTTVEWVGLAVVALALMVAISAFIEKDVAVGGAIADKVKELISDIGGGK